MRRRERAIFGSGGNPQNFYDEGFRDSVDIFKWLRAKSIDSYEYQAGNGLRAGAAVLRQIGEQARENNIELSVHAPYYISLASDDDEIIARSVTHVLKTLGGAKLMGAGIIIVHTGGLGKKTRARALEKAKGTLAQILGHEPELKIGLETMGKQNQLGTLEEVLELCALEPRVLAPVADFGHLHAREAGARFKARDDYYRVFEAVGGRLGEDAARYLHCHFSKIEYTQMGEKKHLTFRDSEYGPEFEPLAEVLQAHKLCPNIICESDGTMDTDAIYMKEVYKKCGC